jgi:sodium/bile acid cotransporter 7
VLLPLIGGQLLRSIFGEALASAPSSKKLISRTSESLLLLTIYSTFCDTFLSGFGLTPIKLGTLLVLVAATHGAFLTAAWKLGGLLKLRAGDRVTVMLAPTQKTLAFGLPLIKLVFSGRADLGMLCTPLLLQHPLQLIVGSALTPRLKRYVAEQSGRIGSETKEA